MRRIKLTQGYYAIVDDGDYEFLSQWKWFAQNMGHTVYAARKEWVAGGKGKSVKIFMHRVIAKTPKAMQTDHMDGDGLNNRKRNLRVVTQQENLCNRARWKKGCASNFRGVYLDRRDGVWFSKITVDGKTTYIGRFKKQEEASAAYLSKKAELSPNKFIRSDAL